MKHFTSILCCILFCTFSSAQNEANKAIIYRDHVETLDRTIETLYSVISGEKDSIRDWELFKFLFRKDAKLIPAAKKDSVYVTRYMSPEDYIKSSGKWLIENGFFEKEIARKTETFGNITHVFSTYEAYNSQSDEKPFMRGINSIQLLYDNYRWWIVNLYWTQETSDNPIPEIYLKQ